MMWRGVRGASIVGLHCSKIRADVLCLKVHFFFREDGNGSDRSNPATMILPASA
jgi:hypothetical protein